jgi:hypothetical protein
MAKPRAMARDEPRQSRDRACALLPCCLPARARAAVLPGNDSAPTWGVYRRLCRIRQLRDLRLKVSRAGLAEAILKLSGEATGLRAGIGKLRPTVARQQPLCSRGRLRQDRLARASTLTHRPPPALPAVEPAGTRILAKDVEP